MTLMNFARIPFGENNLEREILVDGQPVVVRMCAEIWAALTDIAAREGMAVDDLVAQIERRRTPGTALESLARIAVLSYWKRMG